MLYVCKYFIDEIYVVQLIMKTIIIENVYFGNFMAISINIILL